ncbi:response regulator transcription factor [Nonomuraea sp. NEAU-A123]|uniref:response regulator transcription factor n=1 Tax=Nonomuraea sp. NEAU-A123 TaxID=2839649 RepID=UPI001BE407B4|nr:response regulator transcription factor [Nonomuraea sp. NEAU-A123]MBT2228388.1 response regulator transcription factor [Nonomuraea sp. NEAU-A123]
MSTALVVDDELQMTIIVEFALTTQGFTVHTAHDGATALNILRTCEVDLVVLDVLMPALDGLTLCERIRARSDVPIMLLSALGQQEDIIAGLERGADDYVTKPFHPRELALRAKALVRRRRGGEETVLRVGDMVVNLDRHTVTISGRRLELPFTEFRLLAHLAEHRGTPQPWQALLRTVWGASDVWGGRDVVKTGVYRLRSRLATLDAAHYVQTVRNAGYLMPDL